MPDRNSTTSNVTQKLGNYIPDVSSRDELDLTRVEDLDLFLESAEDIYADAAQYRADAKAEQYRSVTYDDVKGEEIFETLYALLGELQEQIVKQRDQMTEKNFVIDDANVEAMQKQYDQMILLRDFVVKSYQRKKQETNQPASVPQVKVEQQKGKVVSVIERVSPAVAVPTSVPPQINSIVKAPVLPTVKTTAPDKEEQKIDSKTLFLCGVPVPEAGPQGIAAARTLRQELLVACDSHPELVRDPKKQLLVERLVRKLSFIPKEGLSAETDIIEIRGLAQLIGIESPAEMLRLVTERPVIVTTAEEEREEEEECRTNFSAPKHKDLSIDTENDEQKIEITVTKRGGEARTQKQTFPVEKSLTPLSNNLPKEQPSQPAGQAIVAALERQDPINVSVPVRVTSIISPRPVHEKRSLTKLYLADSFYQVFIAKYYTSASAFERMLDTTITQIEAKTVDIFERWLHEEYASPFAFLEEMTVHEVVRLGSSKEVRQVLMAENIKYETFLTWLDLVPVMQEIVGDDSEMKFGELYARWMIESEMMYYAEQSAK